MRIDGTHGLDPHNLSAAAPPAGKPAPPADTPDAGTSSRPAGADPVLEAYVRQAAAGDEVDLQAVAEAKRLLASGQLDTPEAAERAAETIARLGI